MVTVTNEKADVGRRIDNGATILNVAGGAKTAEIVSKVRADFPRVPIMASGGRSGESIAETIRTGANAIVYTPLSSGELFRTMMDDYRTRYESVVRRS